MRNAILDLIANETAHGRDGHVVLKLNSLVDAEMIDALYAAAILEPENLPRAADVLSDGARADLEEAEPLRDALGSTRPGERPACGIHVPAVERCDVELAAALEHTLEQPRPDPSAPVRRIDEEIDERGGRPVHVERRRSALPEPVAAHVRRRLVPVEGNRLVAPPDGLSGMELVVAGFLDRVESRQRVVRRCARVDLLDLARRHPASMAGSSRGAG